MVKKKIGDYGSTDKVIGLELYNDYLHIGVRLDSYDNERKKLIYNKYTLNGDLILSLLSSSPKDFEVFSLSRFNDNFYVTGKFEDNVLFNGNSYDLIDVTPEFGFIKMNDSGDVEFIKGVGTYGSQFFDIVELNSNNILCGLEQNWFVENDIYHHFSNGNAMALEYNQTGEYVNYHNIKSYGTLGSSGDGFHLLKKGNITYLFCHYSGTFINNGSPNIIESISGEQLLFIKLEE